MLYAETAAIGISRVAYILPRQLPTEAGEPTRDWGIQTRQKGHVGSIPTSLPTNSGATAYQGSSLQRQGSQQRMCVCVCCLCMYVCGGGMANKKCQEHSLTLQAQTAGSNYKVLERLLPGVTIGGTVQRCDNWGGGGGGGLLRGVTIGGEKNWLCPLVWLW